MMKSLTSRSLLLATAALLASCATMHSGDGFDRIEHIVVIYAENHSFDNMYGLFPRHRRATAGVQVIAFQP
jgi:phospholipase C